MLAPGEATKLAGLDVVRDLILMPFELERMGERATLGLPAWLCCRFSGEITAEVLGRRTSASSAWYDKVGAEVALSGDAKEGEGERIWANKSAGGSRDSTEREASRTLV
jgi:hypothetical protein